jgi:hypothetical protein
MVADAQRFIGLSFGVLESGGWCMQPWLHEAVYRGMLNLGACYGGLAKCHVLLWMRTIHGHYHSNLAHMFAVYSALREIRLFTKVFASMRRSL